MANKVVESQLQIFLFRVSSLKALKQLLFVPTMIFEPISQK